MKTVLVATALATVLAACSTNTSAPQSSGASADGSTGIKNSCINPVQIQKQTILSDNEIQFELRNGETWVNRLPRACPGLKLAGGFEWEITGSLVCSNQQRITVIETGTPCQLGVFSRAPSPT